MEASTSSFRRRRAFDFCGLPYVAQRAIIEKLDLMTYMNLRKCSTFAKRMCDCQFHCDLNVSMIYFTPFDGGYNAASCLFAWGDDNRRTRWNAVSTSCRLITKKLHLNRIEDSFDDEKCASLLNFLMKRRVLAEEIQILSDIDCSIDTLRGLFRTVGATRFLSPPCLLDKEGIIGHPFLKELESIVFVSCRHQPLCRLPTSFFLSLRAPILKMPMVRTELSAINQYLKEWQRKERDIRLLRVSTVQSLDNTTQEMAKRELLDGLDAVVVPGQMRTSCAELDKLLNYELFYEPWLLVRPGATLYLQLSMYAETPDVCCFAPR